MPIFERLNDLIKSNINDLIDKAENPEKMVKQIIIDMEDQLRKATQGLGTAMASQNQVKKQLEVSKAQSATWADKAKACLAGGNEELAKQALANKVKVDKLVEQYQTMANSMDTQVAQMRSQVEMLKEKLEEARSKQSMLIARAQMADAKSNMAKSLGNMDSAGAFETMDRMENKIAAKEAQADAFAQVSGTITAADDPFAKMDNDISVNAELEKLKQEMAAGN